MPKSGSVSVNIKWLEDLGKEWNKGYYVKVGLLGDKATRKEGDGITNPELGVIHEFGTVDGKIPARSWLRMPLEFKARDILKFLDSDTIKSMIVHGQAKAVMKKLGGVAEAIIQEAFTTRGFGQWAPNAPSTVANKGSSAPLIDTAQMERAVTTEVKNARDKN